MLFISLLFLLFISSTCHGRRNAPRSSWSSWRRQEAWGLLQQSVLKNPTTQTPPLHSNILWHIRGGDDAVADATATTTATATTVEEETSATVEATTDTSSNNSNKKPAPTLDQRVRAALQKFGLGQPSTPPPPPPPTVAEEAENEKESVELSSSSEESHEDVITSEAAAPVSSSSTAFAEIENDVVIASEVVVHDEPIPSKAAAAATTPLSAFAPDTSCEDGVCTAPDTTVAATSSTTTTTTTTTSVAASTTSIPGVEFTDSSSVLNDEDYYSMAQTIAAEMGVHSSLAMAALIATRPDDESSSKAPTKSEHVQAARTLIEQELERINQIQNDAPEVQQLVSEGYDAFLSRRALAFAEMNMDDARAILLADQLDEEEEQAKFDEAKREEAKNDAVKALAEQPVTEVRTNFDPAQLPAAKAAAPATPEPAAPKPAKKSDVVFEATAAEVQQLVLESPVPVLLDVYADWCGPCKVLGPALEDMAVKAGGAFRLVKVNTDREGVISKALEVTAYPSVYGIRDGQVVHMFQGIPRSDAFIQNFMMNLLVPGYSAYDPPISAQEQKKYAEATSRLAKMAGAACWPFAARERMQDRVLSRLDALVKESGGMAQADDSAKLLRSLLSNVIRDPYSIKFRSVNLANKALEQKVSNFPSAVAILRTVGFAEDGSGSTTRLALKPQQKVINVAPLVVARDCIDKWIDKNRYEIAVAARKRKDDQDRVVLAEEAAAKAAARAAAGEDVEDEEDEAEEDTLPPNSCTIKIRLEGKKKVQEVVLDGDQPLRAVLDVLPKSAGVDSGAEFQLTCAAKRLSIKSSDDDVMKKSLAEHGLLPAASFVIKRIDAVEEKSPKKASSKSRLTQRAAAQKSKKKGSHTMQSIGIYAKDDNNKAELIDGGGGVWYEHDVSDDEPESAEPAKDSSSSSEVDVKKEVTNKIESEEAGDEASEQSETDEGDEGSDDDKPEEAS